MSDNCIGCYIKEIFFAEIKMSNTETTHLQATLDIYIC